MTIARSNKFPTDLFFAFDQTDMRRHYLPSVGHAHPDLTLATDTGRGRSKKFDVRSGEVFPERSDDAAKHGEMQVQRGACRQKPGRALLGMTIGHGGHNGATFVLRSQGRAFSTVNKHEPKRGRTLRSAYRAFIPPWSPAFGRDRRLSDQSVPASPEP